MYEREVKGERLRRLDDYMDRYGTMLDRPEVLSSVGIKRLLDVMDELEARRGGK
jgi:hypothetical protein